MTAMRNPDAKHVDFGELVGIIPSNPKFLPSNIDMIQERNGCFLIGEWKRPQERVSGGQRILLKRLAQQPNFTVLIIIGDTDAGMNVQRVYQISGDDALDYGEGVDKLKEVLTRWYANADRGISGI